MAETSSLLNCRTGNRTGGSNPPLSAGSVFFRGVAQSGSAPGLGPGGPRFESWYPDKREGNVTVPFFISDYFKSKSRLES